MNRSHKSLLLIPMLASFAIAADTPATAPSFTTTPTLSATPGEPVQLFNGKDLDDWTFVATPPKTGGTTLTKTTAWVIKDGLLHSTGKEDARFTTSYLRTNKSFTNYVLTVEQRHVTKGGGGILVGLTGPDKVWPKNLQIQGTFGSVGDFVDQYGLKMTVDPARTKKRNDDIVTIKIAASSEKPLGEWNTVQIFVDHGNVWVTVNGTLQNVAHDAEPLTGTIGLQAEGAQMEFRKIELRPLPD